MKSSSTLEPMAFSHPLKKPVTSGRCFSISSRIVCAFQMKMPEFQKKYSLIGDEVQFLMINVGDDMETAHKYVTKQGYQFPVFYDTSDNAAEVYQISSIPMSYFINSEGKIVAQWLGTIDATRLNAYINLIRDK